MRHQSNSKMLRNTGNNQPARVLRVLHNTRGKVVHTPALKKSHIARRMTQKRGSKTPANTGLLETWLQSPNHRGKAQGVGGTVHSKM